MASFEENFLNYKPPALPEELSHLPDRVSESFAGKTIFITGGSGFLGKVLIEKILRKCPDIEKIYLLLRPKKGCSPKQRIETIFSSVVSANKYYYYYYYKNSTPYVIVFHRQRLKRYHFTFFFFARAKLRCLRRRRHRCKCCCWTRSICSLYSPFFKKPINY